MKDAYYFPHDYNARNDEKVLGLLHTRGMAGYGCYWMLVEMLHEAGGILALNCERIAFALRMDSKDVKAVIEDYGLFEIAGNDGEKSFSSKRVRENIDHKNAKSKKAKESAAKRWGVMC